ncbi:MAG: hypothetical protein Q4F67_13740 [Propionibacteriaceae bacterium]|nr:hypothetical protein [Propionibacteriaceae bacterium]
MEQTGIKRLMMPAAWALVAMLALGQLAQLVGLLSQRTGAAPPAGWGYALLAGVIALLLFWARQERVARPVTVAAVAVTATGLLLIVVSWVVSIVRIASSAPTGDAVITELLGLFTRLIVPALVLAVLWQLLQLTPKTSGSKPALGAGPGAAEPAAEGREPVWEPDRAAGAHWQTAGAAASGGAADWGRPGEQRGGWAPHQPTDETRHRQHVADDQSASVTGGRLGQDVTSPNARQADPTGQPGAAGLPPQHGPTGPQEAAQRFVDPGDTDEDITRVAPPETRRRPPQWTPLEDRTQPPPSES